MSKSSRKVFLPIQSGDVPITLANTSKLKEFVDYVPATPIEAGLKETVDWYLEHEA